MKFTFIDTENKTVRVEEATNINDILNNLKGMFPGSWQEFKYCQITSHALAGMEAESPFQIRFIHSQPRFNGRRRIVAP